MGRTPRGRNLSSRRMRSAPCDLPSYYQKAKKTVKKHEVKLTSEKKDWKHATCSICLESPHDAVLLLCSSHHKGCRPYMCDTSYQHSNCLEQFNHAYLKEKPAHEVSNAMASFNKRSKEMELACPICRGEVKGWTVVEQARQFLNRKWKACIEDDCSFVGSYKELCKHMEAKHPSSKPREVDPVRLAEWKELESDKERQDAISIITALNPGSRIMGDYIVGGISDSSSDTSDSSSDIIDFSSFSSYSSSLSSDSSSDDDLFISSDDGVGGAVRQVQVHRRNGERPRQMVRNIPVGRSAKQTGRRRGSK